VARSTAEETERNVRSQQEAMRNIADPFARPNGDDGAPSGGNGEVHRGQQGAQQSGPGNRPPGASAH